MKNEEDIEHYINDLIRKIDILSEYCWGGLPKENSIKEWINNFETKEEQANALFLASKFMLFSVDQVKVLLKNLYKKFFLDPLLQKNIRDGIDVKANWYNILNNEFQQTRFIPVGNPSESSAHLLYYFRSINQLELKLFISLGEIFEFKYGKDTFLNNNIKRYIFIDDLIGSGSQAKTYNSSIIEKAKTINENISIEYYSLFATNEGLKNIRDNTKFDIVDSLFILDESFKALEENSRYFNNSKLPDFINLEIIKSMVEKYKNKFEDEIGGSTGFSNNQLLLGFYYNIPDNSLPMFWQKSSKWKPFFERIHKCDGVYYDV